MDLSCRQRSAIEGFWAQNSWAKDCSEQVILLTCIQRLELSNRFGSLLQLSSMRFDWDSKMENKGRLDRNQGVRMVCSQCLPECQLQRYETESRFECFSNRPSFQKGSRIILSTLFFPSPAIIRTSMHFPLCLGSH